MNKQELKKEFNERFLNMRKILNSWDLISGAPKDEFDALNHQILSHLYKGADIEKIKHVIDSELTFYYGLSIKKEIVDDITNEIIEWWKFENNINVD